MSSSYEKVVKLACKPKAAPPKAKYMDPIIAATWSEDGAVHDVCKALAPRFREPNAVVVFKALIVLHTMVRNGATDNVLSYLSSSEVLRLRNISSGHWEGYNAPENLQNYATYLDTRIRAYRDLKHDAIRVQSETNRDLRNSQAIEEGRVASGEKPIGSKSGRRRFGSSKKDPVAEESPPSSSSGVQRSKTMTGRKLRIMTVEKGLLRETKTVQKMIDALVECRFYLDNLEDELNISALRMLVKDLLILFQACNEGVINVLEHYFEMSRIDAKDALVIYRHFCKQTERVVEYLGVARKLQNLLSVPIPNLRHAPVSLAGSLEEYLNDPNFEQNRIEYKTNKEAAERNARLGIKAPIANPADKPTTPKPTSETTAQASSSAATPPVAKANSQALIDFFSAIEEEQQSMFNPQTNSPTSAYFQQQATYNPFAQQQMMTGVPFGQMQQQQPMLQMQATGYFPQQQQPTNPFGLQPSQSQPFGNFLQAQPTGFLQPQTTGANPFRQSMAFPGLMSQPTGMPQQLQQQLQVGGPFGTTNPFPSGGLQPMQTGMPSTNPFPTQNPGSNPFPQYQQQQQPPQTSNPFPTNQSPGQNLFGATQPQPQSGGPFGPLSSNQGTNLFSAGTATSTSPFSLAQPSAQPANAGVASSMPTRPMSAPLKAPGSSEFQPVKTHQTGSRNPFGAPTPPTPPPVPKIPTLMELAMGMHTGNNVQGQTQQQQQPQPTGLTAMPTGFGGLGGSSGPGNQTGSIMSSIASSFTTNDATKSTSPSTMPFSSLPTGTSNAPTATGSTFSSSLFSSLSPQTTAASSTSPSISVSPPGAQPLQSQQTGFSGIKPFKPSSSFGAQLMESLPAIPSTTPTATGQPSSSLNGNASLNSQPTGFGGQSNGLTSFSSGLTTGVGLRPQTDATGVANPFRASMFSTSGNSFGANGLGASPLSNSNSLPAFNNTPTGMGSQFPGGPGGAGGFGNSLFGSGAGLGSFGQDPNKSQPQQQNGQSSLI
ncbi:hypothetical protein QCA50_013599 [Cerrena zonata]|uniref:ENTH domain-containing protein n=1 Tax=Cerrena zonata TaxID=2478898 RepID=A0AAW0G1A9_9APHY